MINIALSQSLHCLFHMWFLSCTAFLQEFYFVFLSKPDLMLKPVSCVCNNILQSMIKISLFWFLLNLTSASLKACELTTNLKSVSSLQFLHGLWVHYSLLQLLKVCEFTTTLQNVTPASERHYRPWFDTECLCLENVQFYSHLKITDSSFCN